MTYLFTPLPNLRLASWIFLKALTLIYLAAFTSLAVQISGLVGEQGILPFGPYLEFSYRQLGMEALWKNPTIFWIGSSSWALTSAAWIGSLLSLLLLFGYRERLLLILLFILYLSLYRAGQPFLNFQWDFLLLESGFLAIFLIGGPNRLVIFMYHWLLFRLRFLSGSSKIISDDPTWSSFTTLKFYFETQPLPHLGGWYAHQLPEWILKIATIIVLAAELIVPFFIFLPRRWRISAALITIMIQLGIILTSNHNFVNLLTIALCLFLLDDEWLRRYLPLRWLPHFKAEESSQPPRSFSYQLTTLAAGFCIFSISIPFMVKMLTPIQLPQPIQQHLQLGHRFGIGNIFHIFPTMQTERHELVIEGSYDGINWLPYQFHYKPQALNESPIIHIPHDPRLDWMLWFIPPQNPQMRFWFNAFIAALAENRTEVTNLLRHNPFADSAPPRFLRVLVYRYHFTNFDQRNASGNWWRREYLGEFPNLPPRSP